MHMLESSFVLSEACIQISDMDDGSDLKAVIQARVSEGLPRSVI